MTRKFHPDKINFENSDKVFLKVKEAYENLMTEGKRISYERLKKSNLFDPTKFTYKPYTKSEMKYGLNEKNIKKVKNFFNSAKIFLLIFLPIFLIGRKIISSQLELSKGYSLVIHATLNLRYKTPANKFYIFVERDFLEKYEREERRLILKNAEIEKIKVLGQECENDEKRILALKRKIEDGYSSRRQIEQEISRIKKRSVCSKLERYDRNFKRYFIKK